MGRSGRILQAFCRESQEVWLTRGWWGGGAEQEKKGAKDVSEVFGLRNWKVGVATSHDEEEHVR